MEKRTSAIDMKIKNCISLLRIIVDNPGINRKRISVITGLSNQTITNLVRDLMARGVVREVEKGVVEYGRPPIGLEFCYDSIYIISVAITYNQASFYLNDLNGKVLASTSTSLAYGCDLKEIMLNGISFVRKDHTDIKISSVIINAEGISDEMESTIRFIKSLGIKDFNVEKELAELHLPIWLVNDVNLISHDVLNIDTNMQNFLIVKYSSGIGSSTVVNRAITKTGKHNMPGKFSHTKVFGTGEHNKCWCGGENCLATFISQDGLETKFKKDFELVLKDIAMNKDPVYRSYTQKLWVQALTNYIILLGIERIFFCGSSSDILGRSFFKEVDECIKKELPYWIGYRGIELIGLKSCPELSSMFFVKNVLDVNNIYKVV